MESTDMRVEHFRFPPLPYDFDSLEPIIGCESLKEMYRSYKKNVEDLNNAIYTLSQVKNLENYDYLDYWERQIAHSCSVFQLNSMFLRIMAPLGFGGFPGSETERKIRDSFGNILIFKEKFINFGSKVSSGWVLLSWKPHLKRLELLNVSLDENLDRTHGIPVLICEVQDLVYEKNSSNLLEFLNNWWHLINWHQVEKLLLLAFREMVPVVSSDGKITVLKSDYLHTPYTNQINMTYTGTS